MYRKIEKNISKNSPSRTHQTDKISNCTDSVQLLFFNLAGKGLSDCKLQLI